MLRHEKQLPPFCGVCLTDEGSRLELLSHRIRACRDRVLRLFWGRAWEACSPMHRSTLNAVDGTGERYPSDRHPRLFCQRVSRCGDVAGERSPDGRLLRGGGLLPCTTATSGLEPTPSPSSSPAISSAAEGEIWGLTGRGAENLLAGCQSAVTYRTCPTHPHHAIASPVCLVILNALMLDEGDGLDR